MYNKSKNYVTRVIDGETLLIPLQHSTKEKAALYVLNSSAAEVWNLLDKARDLAGVLASLTRVYEVSPTELKRKTLKTIRDLQEIKAIC